MLIYFPIFIWNISELLFIQFSKIKLLFSKIINLIPHLCKILWRFYLTPIFIHGFNIFYDNILAFDIPWKYQQILNKMAINYTYPWCSQRGKITFYDYHIFKITYHSVSFNLVWLTIPYKFEAFISISSLYFFWYNACASNKSKHRYTKSLKIQIW